MIGPKVCSVGELMWDFHALGGETLEEAVEFHRVVGGASANVALELASMGVPAAVAGTLSGDAFGRGLCRALEARGVDCSGVVHRQGRTGLVFVEHRVDERYCSYRPRIEGATTRVRLPRRFRYGVLHIAALNPEPGELDALAAVAEQAGKRGAWVVVDVNARPRAWRKRSALVAVRRVLRHAHLVKASATDLACLGLASERRLIEQTYRRLGLRRAVLVLTRGAESTTVVGPWGTFGKRPGRVRAQWTVGAGDAFCAGMIRGLLGAGPPGERDLRYWRALVGEAQLYAAERIVEPLPTLATRA